LIQKIGARWDKYVVTLSLQCACPRALQFRVATYSVNEQLYGLCIMDAKWDDAGLIVTTFNLQVGYWSCPNTVVLTKHTEQCKFGIR